MIVYDIQPTPEVPGYGRQSWTPGPIASHSNLIIQYYIHNHCIHMHIYIYYIMCFLKCYLFCIMYFAISILYYFAFCITHDIFYIWYDMVLKHILDMTHFFILFLIFVFHMTYVIWYIFQFCITYDMFYMIYSILCILCFIYFVICLYHVLLYATYYHFIIMEYTVQMLQPEHHWVDHAEEAEHLGLQECVLCVSPFFHRSRTNGLY